MNHSTSHPVVGPALRDLLNAISSDAQALVSQTLTLGRLEAASVASKLMWAGVGVVASILAALAGIAVLVSALVLGAIALGLPPWAAALIVGVLLLGAGGGAALYFVGVMRRTEITLKETRESVRETVEWLKLQTGTW